VKAAVYRGAGRLVAEEWPTASIGEGEVLLRLKGYGCDTLADRVTIAGRLGADAGGPADVAARAAGELSGGRGADQVILTGGGTEVLPWAAEILRDGGTVHCFAGGAGTMAVSLERLYRRELTISATYSSSPADLVEAFRLISEGAIEVVPLVTHRVPLASLAHGVDLMRRREALKVYVTP
jgi:threonine dehydrogenase-like Zn-dependent dehydrogenase